jgi:ADP-heptose:LPS heptosyltransferase
MSPNEQRFIDRIIGVPVLFFASFFRREKHAIYKADVLICIAEIGALFVAYEALQKAKKKSGKIPYFITAKGGVEALKLMGVPDGKIVVIEIDSVLQILMSLFSVKRYFKQYDGIQVAVLEPFTRFSHIVAWWIGASKISGCVPFNNEGNYMGKVITNPVVYNPHLHASEMYMSIVDALFEEPTKDPLSKKVIKKDANQRFIAPISSEEQESLREKIQKMNSRLKGKIWVILNANASDIVPLRKWSMENYATLGQKLIQDNESIAIILTGTSVERKSCDELAQKIDTDQILNLAGETTFRELITLYSLSTLLISNDSGPVHFASSTDIKIVALYGPETPSVFGPLSPQAEVVYMGIACSPCVSPYNQKKSLCTDNRCMKMVTVDHVLEVVRAALNTSKKNLN